MVVWVAPQKQVTAIDIGVATPSFPVLPPNFELDSAVLVEESSKGRSAESTEFVTIPQDFAPINYGVNFITSADYPATARRYQDAQQTGATWDRFPIYWQEIELSSDQFDFGRYDSVVANDLRYGYQINAILMGVPGIYFTNGKAVPNTLNDPIFDDGTDIPGPNKTISNRNKWAQYVYRMVSRYKPNGSWAQSQGLPTGVGVRHWEMWNEPDLSWFFDGTKDEYARLLKVGYYAAKQADPNAQVIFGAIANNYNDINYYEDVLKILQRDSQATATGYFHDIMATHSYYNVWQSWYHVFRAKNTMQEFQLDKPIWLNETGIPAWNDYPGPVWDSRSTYRGTMTEQADYTIQSAFYSLFAGATGYFHFQMYDGCGNQPAGTDFPPHNGDLCTSDGKLKTDPSKPCAGDANGLFRNYSDAGCFRQHPQAGTNRPNLAAYQLITEHLQNVVPLARQKICRLDEQSWISFYRPYTNQRIMALWACTNKAQIARPAAIDSGAELLTPDGNSTFIGPEVDGRYYLNLPGATNLNANFDTTSNEWPLGGRPYILIERDLQPPMTGIGAAPTGNRSELSVEWWGNDGEGSGIDLFDVEVSADGAPFQPWLTGVRQLTATYSGIYREGVQFRVRAKDNGGNWSDPQLFVFGQAQPEMTLAPTQTATPNAVLTRIALTFPAIKLTQTPTTATPTLRPTATPTLRPIATPTLRPTGITRIYLPLIVVEYYQRD